MKVPEGSTYDRCLIALVLLGPLVMLALGKWRAALDGWFVQPDQVADVFGASFLDSAVRWLQHRSATGAELILIVDRNCPCTRATIARLEAARSDSGDQAAKLEMMDVSDPALRRDPDWRALLAQIPATPTLLAADRMRLLYAGPAISGNICTTTARPAFGLDVLRISREGPILNWLDKGCYCQMDKRYQDVAHGYYDVASLLVGSSLRGRP